jgi:hypothetical protein
MNDNQATPNNLLDTTDCLEAVGVFKGWKNFLFVIILLCLLLLQASFLLVDTGCIEIDQAAVAEPAAATKVAEPDKVPAEPPAVKVPDVPQPVLELTVEPKVVPEPNEPAVPEEAAEPNKPVEPISKARDVKLQRAITWPPTELFSSITFEYLSWLIRVVNAVLILTATLFCLSMLFSLKVSMLGRLGGINHISRAFFLSLLMLILLLPWQRIFGGMALGAMYTPDELVKWNSIQNKDIFEQVLYYLRFSGYWLLVFLLLILSQIRSVRWGKAILRRLEII